MSDPKTSKQLIPSLQSLATNLIVRIDSGCISLSKLETALLAYIDKKGDEIDPNFLLEVCRYFRYSVNSETRAVLDFVSNSRFQMPRPSMMPDDDLVRQIQGLPASERDKVLVRSQ